MKVSPGRAVRVAVDVDDRNARGLRRLDRNGRRGRAGGNVDQRVDVLRKQILDLVHLGRRVALRVDGNHLDALLCAGGFDRLLDLVEEVRLQVGDRKADQLGVLRLRPQRREQCDRRDRGEQQVFPNSHFNLLVRSWRRKFRSSVSAIDPSGPRSAPRPERHRPCWRARRTELANSSRALAIPCGCAWCPPPPRPRSRRRSRPAERTGTLARD